MKRTALIALVSILAIGAAFRLGNAVSTPLELIERDEFIPGALSLAPGHFAPRLSQHGVLPMYLIRFSGLAFGNTTTGLRMLSVVAGTATILLLYLIGTRWWGRASGLAAAGLLAVERYHVEISARAIDLAFDLFFIAMAIYAFSRFLFAAEHDEPRAGRWLYGTAVATALAFLCKEFSALLVPMFAVSLVTVRQARWFRRREAWIAAGLFALLISPDVISNATVSQDERTKLRDRHLAIASERGVPLTPDPYVRNGLYMSYGDHLSRFRSIGFNSTPFYFYVGDLLDAIGIDHYNGFDEFPYLHPVMGILLLTGVAASLFRRPRDKLTIAAQVLFFGTFVPFTLVQLGAPRGVFPTNAEALFYWVDRTMLLAMLLTGQIAGSLVRRVTQGRAAVSLA